MKCPHCLANFHENFQAGHIEGGTGRGTSHVDLDGRWSYSATVCPACKRIVIFIEMHDTPNNNLQKSFQVWPKGIARGPLPKEIPEEHAADYREACLVLVDSPKASAALSRRCLQHLLRQQAKVKPTDLANEIQEVLDSRSLPSYLADALDAVRHIGNFAAHPIKSKSTGEIVEVEFGEADWLLDTLERLFDFYFVQPAMLKDKRNTLNEKLKHAGKPPMKGN
jgi:Domain of unknown function (DUF4145)